MKRPADREVDPATALAVGLSSIARIMIRCELGIGAMVQAAKLSFLRAAIAEVVPPGARKNVSRLAVVTGMTRKEVASLLEHSKSWVAAPRLEQRALKVLRGWRTDPRFLTPSGKPIDLKLQGDAPTFASLVRAYGGDVTTRAVLKELERTKAVTRDRTGKIRLRSRFPRRNARSTQQLLEFCTMLRDFTDTLSQAATERQPPLYFGFREAHVTSATEAAQFHRTFSRRSGSLLESVEQWRDRHLSRPGRQSDGGTSVGIGVYLVQREYPIDERQRGKRTASKS
jgi:uncharacterized protein DUF6502